MQLSRLLREQGKSEAEVDDIVAIDAPEPEEPEKEVNTGLSLSARVHIILYHPVMAIGPF